MNKKVLIGLGVLAVAGIGFYMWKKKQGEVSETETKTPETKPEEKANALGRVGRVGTIVSPKISAVKAPNPTNVGVGKWTCPSGWKVCQVGGVVSCCAGGFM